MEGRAGGLHSEREKREGPAERSTVGHRIRLGGWRTEQSAIERRRLGRGVPTSHCIPSELSIQ